MESHEVLNHYDEVAGLYNDLTQKMQGLISVILEQQNVKVHSVTCRVKTRESLLKKLSRPDGSYNALSDVTDVSGIRITTFFSDDVDRVAEILEQEFDIDLPNSIDKRAALDPDRFGYLSLHHVVSVSPERCNLLEYRRFAGLKCEIQTRSILQHAWAEIEHDLGYKAASSIPNQIRRRFSRLAGLLELADQEFTAIRKELTNYENTVGEKIRTSPESVEINKASLMAYVNNSGTVKRLDEAIASFDEGTVSEDEYSDLPQIWEAEVRRLVACGIDSIAELDKALADREKSIIAFAAKWLSGEKQGRDFAQGVSLLYLTYVLVGETGDKDLVMKFLRISSLPTEMWEELADSILDTCQSIST
jgi:ppGpp synthetase/RelA/SpoT-type nucleotidyltranferase